MHYEENKREKKRKESPIVSEKQFQLIVFSKSPGDSYDTLEPGFIGVNNH